MAETSPPRPATPTPRPPHPLTGAQRRFLRALAHHLDPVVQIGRQGLTEGVLRAVDQALDDHELVKVKVLQGAPMERAEAAPLLAAPLGAHVAGQMGRIVMLYRMHPQKPRILLPRAGRPGRVRSLEETRSSARARDPRRRPATRRRRPATRRRRRTTRRSRR